MTVIEEERGLVWSFGGWFGGLFGATFWMLLTALVVMVPAPRAALVVFAIFALVNAVGIALWQRRERLAVHPALQILIWVSGFGSMGALFALGRLGGFAALPGQRAYSDVKWALLVLAMTVVLSILIWRREVATRAGRTASS